MSFKFEIYSCTQISARAITDVRISLNSAVLRMLLILVQPSHPHTLAVSHEA